MSSGIQGTVKIGQREKIWLIIGLYCLITTTMLAVYEFATGLPKILGDLGGVEFASLVFTVNFLGSAIISPIAGKLSHIYGRRQVLISGAILLILAEGFAAATTNIYQLLVLRGFQGIGGGFAITISLIVIADVCTKEERAKYIGLYGSLMAAFMIAGPLLGGLIVDNFSWRWIFISVVPIGLAGLLLILRFMPHIPKAKDAKVDVLGSLLMAVTVSLTVLISIWGGQKYAWSSFPMISLYILTIICGWLFVAVEKRTAEPIMPTSIFGNSTFRKCFLGVFLATMAGTAITYYFPMWAQQVRGMSATNAGLLMTAKGAVALVAAWLNGWIISRVKEFRYNALVVMLLFTLACFSYYMMGPATSMLMIGVTMVVWGLSGGYSSVFHIGTQMSLTNLQIVTAMGALQLGVSIGSTFGNIIIGILLKNPDFAIGMKNVFLFATVLSLITVLLSVSLLFERSKVQSPVVSDVSGS